METFQIVHLPDTQFYSASYPSIFAAQTAWCNAQATANNIKLISHTGDIVDDANSDAQWSNAKAAMDTLLDAGCAFTRLPGNHDQYNPTKFKATFPVSDFAGKDWFVGHSNDELSMASQFTAGGQSFLNIAIKDSPPLSFASPTGTLVWARALMQAHPNHRVILSTHWYMETNGTLSTVGQFIWDNLIVPFPNVFLVLCGHRHGVFHRTDTSSPGFTVDQLLADYQSDPFGGGGYLRVLQITV